MEWSKNQLEAINTDGKNILISASAGAGKTTVLIARLMHLIKDEHIGVNEILAMTFTEAAAGEMKKRLTRELHDLLKSDCDKEYVRKQLADLNSANISTIHGFCLEIIKEYYYVINLDKRRINNPIDPNVATSLQQEALNKVVNSYFTNQVMPQLIALTTTKTGNIKDLNDIVFKFAELAVSRSDTEAFFDECENSYKVINKITDLDDDTKEAFFDYFKVQVNLLIKQVENAKLADHSIKEYDVKAEYYKECLKYLENEQYGGFVAAFKTAILSKMPPAAKYPSTKKIRAAENEKVLSLLFPEREYVNRHNRLKDINDLFVEITRQYLNEYELLKEKLGVIDFSDMEGFALKILQADNGYVADIYRKRFKTIMVDEFQDSNDVQDKLVNLIKQGNNVFRVGDVKQSIYGFRQAEPRIMMELINNVGEKDDLIYLSNNYRSTKTIVEFNNQLFSILMNLEELESSYDKNDYVEIGNKKQEQIKTPVKIHMIDVKSISENENDDDSVYNDIKADYIAHKIAELHSQENKKYKDIVILTRGNSVMEKLDLSLSKLNIPCFYSKKDGFLSSASVESVICFLKSLINPYDDLNFVSILTSAIFRMDVEKLADARINKDKDQSYYEYFKEEEFLKPFIELRENRFNTDLSVIIDRIYAINDFYTDYLDRQEQANLDLLYDLACREEHDNAATLNSFISNIQAQEDIKIGEAMPIGANDDVVRIMTIHGSKGLQFDTVFLYSSFQFKNVSGDNIRFNSRMHIGMKYCEGIVRYPTIKDIAMRQDELKSFLEEEQRLLYVALTRAKNELHIVDVKKSVSNNYDINEFYSKKGYSGWIMSAKNSIDGSLYEYELVEEGWSDVPDEKKIREYHTSKYSLLSEKYSMAAPSDSELRVRRPRAFSINEDAGFDRGTSLHRLAELLPLKNDWDDESIRQAAKKAGVVIADSDYRLLQDLKHDPVYASACNEAEVYREYPFLVKNKNQIVHGYMDFVAVGKKVVMIDYKTDRGTTEALLKDRYGEQINAYRESLKNLFPNKNIEAYIYSFGLKKMIEM